MKLNIGCGETKFEGFINIDLEDSTEPDLIHDIRKSPFPYDNETVEEIRCLHNIEHTEYKYWPVIFAEFHRVLIPNGLLLMSYPEFSRAAHYFITNYRGQKEFWRHVLYGRQLYPGDYHVTPVESKDLANILRVTGFVDIKYAPEHEFDGSQNTILSAHKGKRFRTQEDLILEEVFSDVI